MADRLDLLCLPYAGGSARLYRPWAEVLPAWVQLCPVELPGRGLRVREPPCDQIVALVSDVAEQVRAHVSAQPEVPYVLLGHSLGAVLAYEAARRLQSGGLPAAGLIVCAHRAPHRALRERRIAHLGDDGFVERLRELAGTPEEVFSSPELMRLLLPVLRADFRVAEQYAPLPGPLLDCPVTAIGGLGDEDVPLSDLIAWRSSTSSFSKAVLVPGGHFFPRESCSGFMDVLVNQLRAVCCAAPRPTAPAERRAG
jgi:surfactin synthase thioesterase subunit